VVLKGSRNTRNRGTSECRAEAAHSARMGRELRFSQSKQTATNLRVGHASRPGADAELHEVGRAAGVVLLRQRLRRG
jgi:hypothetical protein